MEGDNKSICEDISSPSLQARADAAGIVWGKVGAYPFWPAQLLPASEVLKRTDLLNSKRSKTNTIPVMFFGDYTVAWISPTVSLPWAEGLRRLAHLKESPGLKQGLEEVERFLAETEPVAPEYWWTRPGAEQTEVVTLPQILAQVAQQAAAVAAASKPKAKAKPAKAAGPVKKAKVPKARAATSRKPPASATIAAAASAGSLHAGVATAAAVSAPVRRGTSRGALAVNNGKLILPRNRSNADVENPKNKLPDYVHLKQNIWVSMPRPKRLDRDEMEVCDCRPPRIHPDVLAAYQAQKTAASLTRKTSAATTVDAAVEPAAVVELTDQELAKQIAAAAIEAAIARYEASGSSGVQQQQPVSVVNIATGTGRASRMSGNNNQPVITEEGPMATALLPSSYPGFQGACGENCLNRLSFVHCDPKTCPCGELCTNRPFYQLPAPAMEVQLTEEKGWGVFANESIQRGTFIAEYAGEVIDDPEVARRQEEFKRLNEPHFYMMEMAPGLTIDARYKGNVARLLNSSCDPNCETQKWHDAATGEVRVGLFTIRDVAPGEELMYDYHFQHFGQGSSTGEYTCRCGAPRCRGTMVHKDKDLSRDLHKRVDIWWPNDNCYYRATVIGYSAATGKHTLLYDDGEKEKILLSKEQYQWVGTEEDAPPAPPAAASPSVSAKKNSNKRALAVEEGEQLAEQAAVVASAAAVVPAAKRQATSPTPAKEEEEEKVKPEAQNTSHNLPPAAIQSLNLPAELLPAAAQLFPPEANGIQGLEPSQLQTLITERLPAVLAGVRKLLLLKGSDTNNEEEEEEEELPDGPLWVKMEEDASAIKAVVVTRKILDALCGQIATLPDASRAAYLEKLEMEMVSLMKFLSPVGASPQVDNPGAMAVAGALHGNGAPATGRRSSAGGGTEGRRKRQKRNYGDDFVVDEAPAPGDVDVEATSQGEAPISEHKPTRGTRHTAASASPAPEPAAAAAAGTDDASNEEPAAQQQQQVATGSRIAPGPTPASTGLPARTILVAKKLTHSDVSKGRILLPRAAVEANLSFAIGRAHSLSAKDHNGVSWEFTLQSWANGMESRRVYVLEHAGDYIRSHVLKQEDVIGISCTPEGEFLVEYNTGEVRTAAETQQAARVNPALAGPAIAPAPDQANPLIQHNYGRCTRSEHCNKPAGHPGFCMRTAGGAARARGRGRGRRGGRGGRGRGRGRRPAAPAAAMPMAHMEADDIDRPRRDRRPSTRADDDQGDLYYDEEGDDMMYDDGDDYDYVEDGSDGDSEGYDDGRNASRYARQPYIQQQHHHALDPYRDSTPPREPGGSVPPIFVMANDANAPPQMPPHLRSPLRPHLAASQQSQGTQPGAPNLTTQPSISSPSGAKGVLPLHRLEPAGVPAPVAAPSLPSPASLALPQPVAAPTLPAVLGVDTAGTTGGGSGSGQKGPSPLPPLSVPLFGAAPPANGPTNQGGGGGGQNADFDVMSFLDDPTQGNS